MCECKKDVKEKNLHSTSVNNIKYAEKVSQVFDIKNVFVTKNK